MRIKKLILLLVVLSVLISGCLNLEEDKDQKDDESGDSGRSSGGTQRYEELQTPEETITSEETVTSDETETPVETETLEETDTPEGTAEEMLTPEAAGGTEEEKTENMTSEREEAGIWQSAENEQRTYLVRLREYVFIPSELKIKTGDLVVWRNFKDTVFTLTSKEELFEDRRLGYGNTYNYTFNETGSYNFSVDGYPDMQMTITVK